MNEFDQKIELLSREISDAKAKVNTALRSTVIFYLIIIIGVTVYTLYLGSKIREMATPQTVATMIGSTIKEQMPEVQRQLVQQAKTQAPILAKQTIDAGEKMLPEIEILAKTKIDAGVTMLVDHTVNKAMPVVLEHVKEKFDEISKHKALVSDKKMAETIADILSEEVAGELDKVFNASFYNALNNLQKDIDAIAQKAPGKLTQRELAEKRVIIYWLYLVENAEPGASPLAEVLRLFPEYQFTK